MKTSDPFSGMAAFLTAAQSLNFTAAGRKLGQTPSAISKAISRLEAELDIKLFLRNPRHLTLTQEGELYYQHCKDLLSTVNDARALVTGQSMSGSGHLRICLPISFGQQVIAPALQHWRNNNPAITLEIVLSDRQVDLVAERFDLAIYSQKIPDSRLIAKALPQPEFVTAASPQYVAKYGVPNTPSELNDHACLGYIDASTNRPRPWRFQIDSTPLEIQPDYSVISDQGSFLLEHAINDGGILQAPHYLLAKALHRKQLTTLFNNQTLPGPPWWLVYPQRRDRSLKLHLFIDFVLSHLTSPQNLLLPNDCV